MSVKALMEHYQSKESKHKQVRGAVAFPAL